MCSVVFLGLVLVPFSGRCRDLNSNGAVLFCNFFCGCGTYVVCPPLLCLLRVVGLFFSFSVEGLNLESTVTTRVC